MNMPRRLSCQSSQIRAVWQTKWMFNFIFTCLMCLQRELLIPFQSKIECTMTSDAMKSKHYIHLGVVMRVKCVVLRERELVLWNKCHKYSVDCGRIAKHSTTHSCWWLSSCQIDFTFRINVPNLRQQQHSSAVRCVWSTTHHITYTQNCASRNSVKCVWAFPFQIYSMNIHRNKR